MWVKNGKKIICSMALVVLLAGSLTACGGKKAAQVEVIHGFEADVPAQSEPVIIREEQTGDADSAEKDEQTETESESVSAPVPFVDRGEGNRAYEIVPEVYESGTAHITYPQFHGMEDAAFEERVNADILEAVLTGSDDDGLVSYDLSFETADAGLWAVSFILKGYRYFDGAAYPQNIVKTINIDIETGESIRFTDYCDFSDVVSCLENKTGYRVVSDGIDEDDFSAFLNNGYVTDYAMTLLDYDLDFNNQTFVPTGYSAIRNNHLVLFIQTEHALGDYVEIEFDKDL